MDNDYQEVCKDAARVLFEHEGTAKEMAVTREFEGSLGWEGDDQAFKAWWESNIDPNRPPPETEEEVQKRGKSPMYDYGERVSLKRDKMRLAYDVCYFRVRRKAVAGRKTHTYDQENCRRAEEVWWYRNLLKTWRELRDVQALLNLMRYAPNPILWEYF